MKLLSLAGLFWLCFMPSFDLTDNVPFRLNLAINHYSAIKSFENIDFFDYLPYNIPPYNPYKRVIETLKIPYQVFITNILHFLDPFSTFNFMICSKSFKSIVEHMKLKTDSDFPSGMKIFFKNGDILSFKYAILNDNRSWSKFKTFANKLMNIDDLIALILIASLGADAEDNLIFTDFVPKRKLLTMPAKEYFNPILNSKIPLHIAALRSLIKSNFGPKALDNIYNQSFLEITSFTQRTFIYLLANYRIYNFSFTKECFKYRLISVDNFDPFLENVLSYWKKPFCFDFFTELMITNDLNFYPQFKLYFLKACEYFTFVLVPPKIFPAFMAAYFVQDHHFRCGPWLKQFSEAFNYKNNLRIFDPINMMILKVALEETENEHLDDSLRALKFVLLSEAGQFDATSFKNCFAEKLQDVTKFCLNYLINRSKISAKFKDSSELLFISDLGAELLQFLNNQTEKNHYAFQILNSFRLVIEQPDEAFKPVFLKVSCHVRGSDLYYYNLQFLYLITCYIERRQVRSPIYSFDFYKDIQYNEWFIFALEHTNHEFLDPIIAAMKHAFFPENGLFDIAQYRIFEKPSLALNVISRLSCCKQLKHPDIYAKTVVFGTPSCSLNVPRMFQESIPFQMRTLKDLSAIDAIYSELAKANKLMTFTYISTNNSDNKARLIHLKSHFNDPFNPRKFLKPGISGLDLLFFDDSDPLISSCLSVKNVNSYYHLSLNHFEPYFNVVPQNDSLTDPKFTEMIDKLIIQNSEWTLLELAIALHKFTLASLIFNHPQFDMKSLAHKIHKTYSLIELSEMMETIFQFDEYQAATLKIILTEIDNNYKHHLNQRKRYFF